MNRYEHTHRAELKVVSVMIVLKKTSNYSSIYTRVRESSVPLHDVNKTKGGGIGGGGCNSSRSGSSAQYKEQEEG